MIVFMDSNIPMYFASSSRRSRMLRPEGEEEEEALSMADFDEEQ